MQKRMSYQKSEVKSGFHIYKPSNFLGPYFETLTEKEIEDWFAENMPVNQNKACIIH